MQCSTAHGDVSSLTQGPVPVQSLLQGSGLCSLAFVKCAASTVTLKRSLVENPMGFTFTIRTGT
eukprot:1414483-Rhodomonas_salina.2